MLAGSLHDRESDRKLLDVMVAWRFWQRLRGLQLRRRLSPSQALLLVPGRSIHTCFVFFALDVYFLDPTGLVLGSCLGLRPFRLASGPQGTQAVLEVAHSENFRLQTGQRLRLVPAKAKLPEALAAFA